MLENLMDQPIEELRKNHQPNAMVGQDHDKMIEDAKASLVINTKRIRAEDYFNYFGKYLMSGNENTTRAATHALIDFVGGHPLRPLFIVEDEAPHRVLFFIPSIQPSFGTNTDVNFFEGMTTKFFQIKTNQLNRFHSFIKEKDEELKRIIGDQVDVEGSIRNHYAGWFEIHDFFGRIYGDEKKFYDEQRVKRKASRKHYFWKHASLTIDEYIEKYGRPEYAKPYWVDLTIPEDEREEEIPIIDTSEIKTVEIIDTDDWE